MNTTKKLIKIITFYKFVSLNNYLDLQDLLYQCCKELQIKGTILISPEGINATVAGPPESIDKFIKLLKTQPELNTIAYNVSYHVDYPFLRLKVKIKTELFNLNTQELSPSKQTGAYVAPEDWNALISDPNTITIDPRNDYESSIGTFKYAVHSNINTFGEFPQYFANNFNGLEKNQPIAMYCTGGIRCEKSTAYLLKLGFKQVYHLQGGILNYLSKIPPATSLWQGECFVFDQRIGLNAQLQSGNYPNCNKGSKTCAILED